MKTENKVYHFNVWKAFHNKVYKRTLTQEHIINKGNEKFIENVFEIVKEEGRYSIREGKIINDKCIFLEKNGKIFIMRANAQKHLPVNVKESFECFLKPSDKTVNRFIRRLTSARIPEMKTMTLKQLVERFNPMTHSDPKSWTFLKLQSIVSKAKGGKYRLCGVPACVDSETEFLTPSGWKKIKDYKPLNLVLQYDKDKNKCDFVHPLDYIKTKSKGFYHIKNKYLDMKLTRDHKVIFWEKKGKEKIYNTEQIVQRHNYNKIGFSGRFKTDFKVDLPNILKEKSSKLRLFVATSAEGTINKEGRVVMRLKKEYKKERIELLLKRLNIEYSKSDYKDGYSHFRFYSPWGTLKIYDSKFWCCDTEQLKVIGEECLLWDGNSKDTYYTSIKQNADFIQYCFANMGYRASISICDRRGKKRGKYVRKSVEYVVKMNKNNLVSLHNSGNKNKIPFVKSKDGYQYCFTVPSGFLVLRRNNKVFITGNCGKNCNDTIIHQISNDNKRVSKPTIAKLETLFFFNQKVILDEITSLTPKDVREIEPFVLNIADESPVMEKHSMAQRRDMNEIDLTQSSTIFTYNDRNNIQKGAKFFEDVWQNIDAFRSRYPAFYVEGEITESIKKVSMQEAQFIMEDNYLELVELSKNLLYYFKNLHQEFNNWDRSLCTLKGRHRTNAECLIDGFDVYSESQEEFNDWMIWLTESMRKYDVVNEQVEEEHPGIIEEKVV